MIRHVFIAGLRILAANRLQSVIAIGGLVIGLCAAIIAVSVARNQASYDHFIPGHERIYYATLEAVLPGQAPLYLRATPHDLAAKLRLFPGVEAVARTMLVRRSLRHGDVEGREDVSDADPDLVRVLPLRVLHGRLEGALDQPGSVILPRAIARKYFGRDDVAGERLELERRHPLTIRAVIEDMPQNGSTFPNAVLLSSRSAFSSLAQLDEGPKNNRTGRFLVEGDTILRLTPGANPAVLRRQLQDRNDELLVRPPQVKATLGLIPIGEISLNPNYSPQGWSRLLLVGIVAAVILVLAGVNFVNLALSFATRRAREIGIRKAVGAGRLSLIAQFMGEALIQVLLAFCLALMLAEWMLPAVNAFLETGADLDYGRAPGLFLAMLAGACVIGLLAGTYPALILSAFRPIQALAGAVRAGGSARLRQILVMLQFVILIVLVTAAGSLFSLHQNLMRESMRFQPDQSVFVAVDRCDSPFRTAVAALAGVRATSCSGSFLLGQGGIMEMAKLPDGGVVNIQSYVAGPGFLESYGFKPLAGRFFVEGRVGDVTTMDSKGSPPRLVLNAMAAKRLGYARPGDAIGKTVRFTNFPAEVIGVVEDFSFGVGGPAAPIFFYVNGPALNPPPGANQPEKPMLHVRLAGQAIPETLAAIDVAWERHGADSPIVRQFIRDYVESRWQSVSREGRIFGILSGVALLLGCLGLFALSHAAAERRIKELGVRKAMGASSRDVLLLLLRQFLQPVLAAAVIAWPLTYWLTRRIQTQFAYDVPPWPFAVAIVITLLIAILTVAGQAWAAARQRPVLALRYE